MENWSQKHTGRNKVAIIELGENSDDAKSLARKISSDFSVIFPNINIKTKFGQNDDLIKESTFIVILSDIYEFVSIYGYLSSANTEKF